MRAHLASIFGARLACFTHDLAKHDLRMRLFGGRYLEERAVQRFRHHLALCGSCISAVALTSRARLNRTFYCDLPLDETVGVVEPVRPDADNNHGWWLGLGAADDGAQVVKHVVVRPPRGHRVHQNERLRLLRQGVYLGSAKCISGRDATISEEDLRKLDEKFVRLGMPLADVYNDRAVLDQKLLLLEACSSRSCGAFSG